MAANPRFSVVIPTLRRADTLASALETVLAQSNDDLEVIVQNNGGDRHTREVVDARGDARVRHHQTESVIPMIDNWETALAHARGDWIMVLGDDDGLLPDACEIVTAIARETPLEIVSWAPFLYLWPGYVDTAQENRLDVTLSFTVRAHAEPARPLLQRFYRFEAHYSRLPMIYNSFVRRSLIDRLRARYGSYFFGTQPDVTSGIINAAAVPAFVRLARPLSVAGLSHHSTGHNAMLRPEGLTERTVGRDFPTLDETAMLPGVRGNLETWIASDMLLAKQLLLADDPSIELDPHGLVRAVAASANRNLDRYDKVAALVVRLAEHFSVDTEGIELPPRTATPITPVGMQPLPGGTARLILDGTSVGLRGIADAVRLAAQLVPSASHLEVEPAPDSHEGVPIAGETPLGLGSEGNGTGGLVEGWSEPEAWGTWSVGPSSVIRVAVPHAAGTSVTLALDFRTFPLPSGDARTVTWHGPAGQQSWSIDAQTAHGRLLFDVLPDATTGVVELDLRHDPVASPASLGIGPDPRPISIGVEQISVADPDGGSPT